MNRLLNRLQFAICLLWLLCGVSSVQAESLSTPFYVTPRAGAGHIDLNGKWELGHTDGPVDSLDQLRGQEWIETALPGSVQMALYHAGKLPNPYVGMNSKLYDWVPGKVWYYRKEFSLGNVVAQNSVILCFDGVDYFSRVWLNGHLLGEHQGMLGGPEIDVSQWVRENGPNELIVEVKAANWGAQGKFDPNLPGSVIKPWSLAGGDGAEPFFSMGIWRPVRLEIVPKLHMDRPFLSTETANADEAKLHLSVEVLTEAIPPADSLHFWHRGELNLFRNPFTAQRPDQTSQLEITLLDKGRIVVQEKIPLQLFVGRNWVEHSLLVRKPHLWWPNGMGDPYLYMVRLRLLEQTKQEDSLTFDYGIRTFRTVPSAGPRSLDFWENWQFEVNGKPFFVKGMNWMAPDILYDLPRTKYEWLLTMAKNANIQMMRVWGGSIVETDDFYELCDKLGILVWQEFPLSNMLTPSWPQGILEDQIAQNIFRLRNHASLAVWCDGNESNPYATDDAASTSVIERTIREFDPTRPYRRASPNGGDIHNYPDADPTWFGRLTALAPFISETGIVSVPGAPLMREVVSSAELKEPLSRMDSNEFAAQHPEIIRHFVEYKIDRIRTMSRASQVEDVRTPTIETLAEATQISAGEYYQIESEGVQNNYPMTTGLLFWVFARSWPTIAIQLVDGFEDPLAAYYFTARTYKPEHVTLQLPYLLWAPGEVMPIHATVLLGPHVEKRQVTVKIFDPELHEIWQKSGEITSGPSVGSADLGGFTIPQSFEEQFFFADVELRDSTGRLLSRSVYWPRCLHRMTDAAFRAKYRAMPSPSLTFDSGPWLKPQVEKSQTVLHGKVLSQTQLDHDHSQIVVQLRNAGSEPSFLTQLDIDGARSSYYSNDNYFWLSPGEDKVITVNVLWRDSEPRSNARLSMYSWNARKIELPLQAESKMAVMNP